MSGLQVGFELLGVGLIVVFLVLLVLMFIMKLLSKISAKLNAKSIAETTLSSPVLQSETVDSSSEEETAAIIAAIAKSLPENCKYAITIRS